MTSLPTWAVWALSFGSPAITLVVAFVGQYLTRRVAQDLEARSKREEFLRNLRWAGELAVSGDEPKARLGIQQLQALRSSRMLSSAEEGLIDAALRAAVEAPRQAITQAPGDVEVVPTTSLSGSCGALVSSEDEDEQAEMGI